MKNLSLWIFVITLAAVAAADGSASLDEKLSRRTAEEVRAEFLVREMSSESREVLTQLQSNRESRREERTEGRLEMLRENRMMKFREEGFRSSEPLKNFEEKNADWQ